MSESDPNTAGGDSPESNETSEGQRQDGTHGGERRSTPTVSPTQTRTDRRTRRIRTLSIFFLGIGSYAVVGAGLDAASLLLDNLTTYFVSGGVVLAVGVLLLMLTR